MSYIFEIAKLKHSKCDDGYLVTIVTQAAPLYSLGPCFGIFIIIINVTKTGDGEGANDQAEPMRIRENLKKLVRDF